jgi:peptidoglycan/LPS O-acetylase OafA/YrhL
VVLAGLDELIPRRGNLRLALGVGGFVTIFGLLWLGAEIPYPIIHDGLLMPLFGCVILGLSGENLLAKALGVRPLVFVGSASYCLYLLHFNFWNLIHDTHVLNRLHLKQFDPWISYCILVALALVALHFVEKPAQRQLRRLMHAETPKDAATLPNAM